MINDIFFFLKKNLILDLFIHNGVKERERERERVRTILQIIQWNECLTTTVNAICSGAA
jgi:hypothetical protein